MSRHLPLNLKNISVRFSDRTVLDNVSLTINPQDRIAVIGDNGSGKSTLLGVLAGTVSPTAGEREVDLPDGLAVAEQNPVFAPGATVRQALDDLLSELTSLKSQLEAVSDELAVAPPADVPALMEILADVTDRFEARDGYTLGHRVDSALDQLGLGHLDRSRPVDELSGGERARLSLAAALCSGAEALLLDEPTNDLDGSGVTWLEEQVDAHRGALVTVSHDRAFLDRATRDIVEIRDAAVHRYGNGYPGYLRARDAERLRIRQEYRAWTRELTRCEELAASAASVSSAIPRGREKPGFGHGAFRARSADHGATGRIRQAKAHAELLRANPPEVPSSPLVFSPGFAAAVDPVGTPLVTLQPGRLVPVDTSTVPPLTLEHPLDIRVGDRWLVTGPNGAGKSTLLRMLAGVGGDLGSLRTASADLRVSRLRQNMTGVPAGTVPEVFARATGTYRQDADAALTCFGLFRTRELGQQVADLSVGQRRRLELAVVLATPGSLLLLDEPTNHLSPDLVEQLESALVDFPGAVVTVTHDRRWTENTRRRGDHREITVRDGWVSVTQ